MSQLDLLFLEFGWWVISCMCFSCFAYARAPAAPGVLPAVAPVAAAVDAGEFCMHGDATPSHDDCNSLFDVQKSTSHNQDTVVAPKSRMKGRWNLTGTPMSGVLTVDMSPAGSWNMCAVSRPSAYSATGLWGKVGKGSGSGPGPGPGTWSGAACGGESTLTVMPGQYQVSPRL